MKRLRKEKPWKTWGRRPARKTRLGDLLRATRNKRGLTLRDVEAATGLLGCGISFLENGRSTPDLMTAYILCGFYRIKLEKLAAALLEDEG